MNFIEIAHAAGEAEATTEHTTASTQDQGVLASLGINGQLLIFQFINFAVVALVVWFLILKPLTKKMTERQKMIDDSIENAKRVKDNLDASEKRYQERIDSAKVEANKIIELAAGEAESLGDEMKIRAKKEIEKLVDHAKHNIQLEKEAMVREIRNEAAELVTIALEKILMEKITDHKDKKIIEEMIGKLKA